MGVFGILRLPFKIARLPLSVGFLLIGYRHRRLFHLPAAGLDEAKAQSIYFALKRAASNAREDQVAQEWLAALQVVQVAFARLLSELDVIETNLNFWMGRLESGRHFWFSLLCHGPVAFVRGLWKLFHGRHAGRDNAELSISISDVEVVEKRVLLFRLLRADLCQALSTVQQAAAGLYLQQTEQFPLTTDSMAELPQRLQGLSVLFRHARRAIDTSMGDVSEAFQSLHDGVHATLDAQQGPEGPATRDRPMLAQALQRVLHVSRLRHIWTQQAQLEEGSGTDVSAEAAAEGAQTRDADTVLAMAHKAVGFMPLITNESTVHTALSDARRAGTFLARRQRLMTLPHWMPMPSQLQQHWLRFASVGIVVSYGTVFLVRHSRLAGSRDLEVWTQAAVDAVKDAWKEHVVGPLGRVRGELFDTFRRRPSIVSMAEYESDRDSLQRMLDDFKTDYVKKRGPPLQQQLPRNNGSSPNNQFIDSDGESQVVQGMELMMHSYEQELKRPLRNLVIGDLMRSLLIQVQKLKVDTESAMLEIDQILRANELSISLVAAVPAFLVAGVSLYGLGRVLTPPPPDPRREALPVRMAMIEVERALEALVLSERGGAGETIEAEGMFVYRLALAYSEAEELFRRHRGLLRSSGDAEWPSLRGDLLELAGPGVTEQKLRTAARMMRVYAVFQQF